MRLTSQMSLIAIGVGSPPYFSLSDILNVMLFLAVKRGQVRLTKGHVT